MEQEGKHVSCYTLMYILRNLGSGVSIRTLAEGLGVSTFTVWRWSDIWKENQRGWPYCIRPEQFQALFERYAAEFYQGDETQAAGDILLELELLEIDPEPYRRLWETAGFAAMVRGLIRSTRMCRKTLVTLPATHTGQPLSLAGEALALGVIAPAMAWQLESGGAGQGELQEKEALDLLARELTRLREKGTLDWLLPAALQMDRGGTRQEFTRLVKGIPAQREQSRGLARQYLDVLMRREVLRRKEHGTISFRGDGRVRLAARYLDIYGNALSLCGEFLEQKGRLPGMTEIDLSMAGDAVMTRMLESRYGRNSFWRRERRDLAETVQVPESFQLAIKVMCRQIELELKEGRVRSLYQAIFLLQCDEYGWRSSDHQAVRPLLEALRKGASIQGETCWLALTPEKRAYLQNILKKSCK